MEFFSFFMFAFTRGGISAESGGPSRPSIAQRAGIAPSTAHRIR
jgi:hypothetical protein